MSSMVYPNESLPSNEDPSALPVGAIIPHPYLNPNPNVAYAAAAAAAAAVSSSSPASTVPSYPHYYGHAQPMFNVPSTVGFYPSTINPSHGHPGDFNNSSPSVASSSSSMESGRKTTLRKRQLEKNKTTNKRKLVEERDVFLSFALNVGFSSFSFRTTTKISKEMSMPMIRMMMKRINVIHAVLNRWEI